MQLAAGDAKKAIADRRSDFREKVLKTLLECIPESLKNHLQSQIFSKNYKTNLLLTEFLIIIKQGNVSSQELVRLEKELFLNN